MSEFETQSLRTAFELGADGVKVITVGKVPFLVMPTDKKVEDIAKFLPPKREAKHALLDIRSFKGYVKEFQTAEVRLFATVGDQPTIRAEFDYLPGITAAKAEEDAESGAERFLDGGERKHVATWTPKLSPEWKAWNGIAGKAMTLPELAEFLDEWNHCCVEPDAATMMELAQTLEANSTSQVRNAMRVKDGSGHISYKVDVVATGGVDGKMTVPDRGELSLPLFEGGVKIGLKFRLRIRVAGPVVQVKILFDKIHDVKRTALAEIIEDVEKALELPVYIEA